MDNKTNKEQILARGTRLADYRKAIGFSQEQFAAGFGIGKSTVELWENGRATGLTRKGAIRIAETSTELKATSKINKAISFTWLYEGKLNETKALTSSLHDFTKHFLSNQKNAAVIEIYDNTHSPILNPGDLVACVNLDLADEKTINDLCLVWQDDINPQLMNVTAVKKNHTLIAQDIHTKKNIEITGAHKASQILWIHKPTTEP